MAQQADETADCMSQSSEHSSGSSDADSFEQLFEGIIDQEVFGYHEEVMMELAANHENASRTRTVYERQLPANGAWAMWMKTNRIYLRDVTSRAHALFRRRFRVTYTRFTYLYRVTSEARDATGTLLFKTHPVDALGVAGVTSEVKLLGALRVLGRASCMDSVAELSNCDGQLDSILFLSVSVS